MPKQGHQTVFRSGMGSAQNPLNTTHDYYPPVNHAARGSATTAMNHKPNVAFDDTESVASGQPRTKKDPSTFTQYQSIKPTKNFMGVKGPSTVPKF